MRSKENAQGIQEHIRLQSVYEELKKQHTNHLEQFEVKLPLNKPSEKYFVLCHLFEHIGEVISKAELTIYIRELFDNKNDVQAARMLSKQNGWHILSGQRGEGGLGKGEYKLVGVKTPYPGYISARKIGLSVDSFEELKKEYDYRCATCGNKEGEPDRYFSAQKVKLQEGHMDPTKELENNCIPQCGECNRQYKDKWIFDVRGRVLRQNNNSSFWNNT